MSTVLSTYTNSRDNNFNLVRFIAALLVLYSHSFALVLGTWYPDQIESATAKTLGSIAVDVFFITSGFLITSSYFARNSLLHFVWARILRIYPALIVAILFCVFIVGLGFTTVSAREYLTSEQTFKFLVKNMTLFFGIEFRLPGVFANIPWENTINGSLWTLPYEVKMYALLAIILTILGLILRQFSIGSLKKYLLFIAIVAVITNIVHHFHINASAKFTHLFSMFFVGAAYYIWRDNVHLSSRVFLLTVIALLMSLFQMEIFFVLYVLSLPYFILYVAYVPSGKVRTFNKVGDYSYGLYIYAFPVQQSISAIIPGVSVASMVMLSLGVTFILSFLSWHLIEKRFLKMKGSYIVFEKLARI